MKNSKRIHWLVRGLAVAAIAGFLAGPAHADDEADDGFLGVVQLKSGRQVRGYITAGDDGSVHVKLEHGVVVVPSTEVDRIETEAEAGIEPEAAPAGPDGPSLETPSGLSEDGGELVNFELGFRLRAPDESWEFDDDFDSPLVIGRLVRTDGTAEIVFRVRPDRDAIFPPPARDHVEFARTKVDPTRQGQIRSGGSLHPASYIEAAGGGAGAFEFSYPIFPLGAKMRGAVPVIQRVYRRDGFEWDATARFDPNLDHSQREEIRAAFGSLEHLDSVYVDDQIWVDRKLGFSIELPAGGFTLHTDDVGLTRLHLEGDDGRSGLVMRVHKRDAVRSLCDLAHSDPLVLADKLEAVARARTSHYVEDDRSVVIAREVVDGPDGAPVAKEDGAVLARGVQLKSREGLADGTLAIRIRYAFALEDDFVEIVATWPALEADAKGAALERALESIAFLRPDLVDVELTEGVRVEARLAEAVAAYAARDFQGAAIHADDVVRSFPNDVAARRVRGFARYRWGKLPAARDDLALVALVEEDDGIEFAIRDTLVQEALEAERNKKWSRSIDLREELILLDPESASKHESPYHWSIKMLAYDHEYRKSEQDEAIDLYKRGIEVTDDDRLRLELAQVYVRWAGSLRKNGRLNEARVKLRRAADVGVAEKDTKSLAQLIEREDTALQRLNVKKTGGKSGLSGSFSMGIAGPAVRRGSGTQARAGAYGSRGSRGVMARARQSSSRGRRSGVVRYGRAANSSNGIMRSARIRGSASRRGTQDQGRRGRRTRVSFVFGYDRERGR